MGHEAPSGTDRTAGKVDIPTKPAEQSALCATSKCHVSVAEAVGGGTKEDVMEEHRESRAMVKCQTSIPTQEGSQGVRRCESADRMCAYHAFRRWRQKGQEY